MPKVRQLGMSTPRLPNNPLIKPSGLFSVIAYKTDTKVFKKILLGEQTYILPKGRKLLLTVLTRKP